MKVFYLRHKQARLNCAEFAMDECPEGWRVAFSQPDRKTAQNDKFHAQIDDIAAQSDYAGRKWGEDDMKRILIDEFADEMRKAGTPLHLDGDSRLIPSEDGRRVIQLGMQSRDFWVSEASQFIEFLNAWASDRGVVFKDETRKLVAT